MVEASTRIKEVAKKTIFPLADFNPDLVSKFMDGWEEGEMRGIFGADPDIGRRFTLTSSAKTYYVDVYEKSKQVSFNAPHLHEGTFGEPSDWTVREVVRFEKTVNGDIIFPGTNGVYTISKKGRTHTLTHYDGSEPRVISIDNLCLAAGERFERS